MVLKSRSWAKDQFWFYENQQQEEIGGKHVKQHNMIAHRFKVVKKLWFLVEVKTLLVKHHETILHYNPLSYFNGVNCFQVNDYRASHLCIKIQVLLHEEVLLQTRMEI